MNESIDVPQITSQEQFQVYYEDGIRNAGTLDEFTNFLSSTEQFPYKPEVTGNLLMLSVAKSAQLTAKTVLEAFKTMGTDRE